MSALKIVVADANRDFFKMLAGYVRFSKNMEMIGASSDCGEVVQLIQKKDPNVLVMDLMLENSDALLSCVRNRVPQALRIQNHLVIPISSDWNGRSGSEGDRQLNDLSECIRKILDLTSAKAQDRTLELQVSSLLRQLGIPAHIKGYQYLRKAILTAVNDPEAMSSVTKILYPDIAKLYGTTAGGVERAIRKAIEVAWDRGNIDRLQRCFGYAVNPQVGKPTNSEFIATIADILYLQQGRSELLTGLCS